MSGNRQRVTILAAVVFAAHVIAIFALHPGDPIMVEIDIFRARRAFPTATPALPAAELEGLNDPLVFAGAHEHGFSAAAWLMRPRQNYDVTNSVAPPRFLSFVRTPLIYEAAESFFLPQPNLPFLEIAVAPAPQRSILTIDGSFQNRPLTRPIEVPTQFASDVLSNTVVEVAVRTDGFPLTARVIASSGSRATDLTALDLAKKARFQPLLPGATRERADLQWGLFTFQWFTTERGATNATRPIISAAK